MEIEMIRAFFGWCAVINIGILIFSFLVCTVAGDLVYRMHSKWFPISRDAFTVSIYCIIGGMKVLVFLLNIVPYLALSIIM